MATAQRFAQQGNDYAPASAIPGHADLLATRSLIQEHSVIREQARLIEKSRLISKNRLLDRQAQMLDSRLL
jgi:hypothetical protein